MPKRKILSNAESLKLSCSKFYGCNSTFLLCSFVILPSTQKKINEMSTKIRFNNFSKQLLFIFTYALKDDLCFARVGFITKSLLLKDNN